MKRVPKGDDGYTVRRDHPQGWVSALCCQFCDFAVHPRNYRKAGDPSGSGRYNRARGVMVKHIYANHRETFTI